MKRVSMISIIVLLSMVCHAYAVEFETTGEFYARGSYISNNDGTSSEDTASFGYYDSELDMTVKLKVSDYTKVITRFEIRDQEWLYSEQDDRPIQEGDRYRDNIDFQRVFASHIFPTGTILDVGLMTGGTFGTTFGDTADGYWRVKVMQKTGIGLVGAILQKIHEEGFLFPEEKDAEKDDGDTYYLFGIFDAGNHKIMPLLTHYRYSHYPDEALRDRDDDGLYVMAYTLAASGSIGTIGYETEATYADFNQDWDFPGVTQGEEYALYGAYLNLWMMLGASKVGGQVAYGSWNNDSASGYGFGEDYLPTMFGADWTNVGTSFKGLSEYSAVTLFNLYTETTLSESLSLYANGTYWISNSDEGTTGVEGSGNDFWKDATGYEIDLGADYHISEHVTYGVLLAYGQFNLDEDAAGYDDADAFYRLYHKFTINF